MPLKLLNSFGSSGVSYGLYNKPADVIDTEYLSRYFVVSEFNPLLTAGKNYMTINGSSFLVDGSEIFIECLDSKGNNLFIEAAKCFDGIAVVFTNKEYTSCAVSIYIYNDTISGVGKLILYGTMKDGRSVKWIQNVVIDNTLKNSSKVIFYQEPVLEVKSVLAPILNPNTSTGGLINVISFTGSIQGLAANPTKYTNLSAINVQNIDYRLTLIAPVVTNGTSEDFSFNSQMIGSIITLNVNRIESPQSQTEIDVSEVRSYKITDVLGNNVLQISQPYYRSDEYGNNVVTNITNADFSIQYLFTDYDTSEPDYQSVTINGASHILEQSYADITYRNIRTFSGYVARYKVYRRSLSANGNFSIIADGVIDANQILTDDLTQNKSYNLLGKFYNTQHINSYWFPSSTNILMSHSPNYAIDSVFISSSSTLSGSDYIIAKNNSISVNKDATYVPFDAGEFLSENGPSYDSNFMALKANVQYIIEISATIIKDPSETKSDVSFYFTSSIPEASKEPAYTKNFGIKVAELKANQAGSIEDLSYVYTFYTPQSDLYGTLIIVPSFCNVYIKNISFKVYGDDGFSPDIYTTRTAWPISIANEGFQIKSELFDINSNLVYSNLSTIQNFDQFGLSLISESTSGSNQIGGGRFIYWIDGIKYVEEPPIMSVIQGGPFERGNWTDVEADALTTVNPIYVNSFAIEQNLVTYEQWVGVYLWASSSGYIFQNSGSSFGIGHPVHSISWYDAVTWCNARSVMDGLTPCYIMPGSGGMDPTDGGINDPVYYMGGNVPFNDGQLYDGYWQLPKNVVWTGSGYRLPTEAEWEKAARGRAIKQRFPWGMTISHSQAYYESPVVLPTTYDLGPPNFLPTGSIPVGRFPFNTFGLYDMSGNMNEWCWDVYDTNYYSSSYWIRGIFDLEQGIYTKLVPIPKSNPKGPADLFGNTDRVIRGGSWNDTAIWCGCAVRNHFNEKQVKNTIGFRCVRTKYGTEVVSQPSIPVPGTSVGYMAGIPSGSFLRGDSIDGNSDGDAPPKLVSVSSFRIDSNLITYRNWNTVYVWGILNGYSFDNTGSAFGTSTKQDQPIHTIGWYDAVKWSNARSELEGSIPIYYTDAGFSQVYKSGSLSPFANWSNNGYRLPTEAEWEMAGRGTFVGQRFPRHNTISHIEATYRSPAILESYDLGPSSVFPNTTTEVGSLKVQPNNYVIYDMAGNLFEWCWDNYAIDFYNDISASADPTGPLTGLSKVTRGGCWNSLAGDCRVAKRTPLVPTMANNQIGFRCVRRS